MRKGLIVLVVALAAAGGGYLVLRTMNEHKQFAARDRVLDAQRDELKVVVASLEKYKSGIAGLEKELDEIRAKSDRQALIAVITRRRASFDLGKTNPHPYPGRPVRITGKGPPRAAVQFLREARARTPYFTVDEVRIGVQQWTCNGRLLDVDEALRASEKGASDPPVPPPVANPLPWNRGLAAHNEEVEAEIEALRVQVGPVGDMNTRSRQVDDLRGMVEDRARLDGMVGHAERLLLDPALLSEATFKPRSDGTWSVTGRLSPRKTALDVTKALGGDVEVSFTRGRVDMVLAPAG